MPSSLVSSLVKFILTLSQKQQTNIGKEQQEEDHRQNQHVRIEEHKNASVVKAPAQSQAAHGLQGPEARDRRRNQQLERLIVIGKRDQEGKQQTAENQHR